MSSSSSSSIQPFSVPPPPNDMNPFAAASLPAAAATAAFAASNASLVAAASSSGGHQWWKYLLILIILGFLMLMLFVYFARKYIPDLSLIFDLLGVFGATAAAANPTKKTGTGATAATAPAGTVQPKTADTQTSSTVFKKQDESAAEHQELVEKPNRGKVAAVPEPMPDDAGSRTQASKASSKAGFCYIGEDRGFRSCIQVKESDTCMSGDIFPTEAICINPNLRE